MSDLKANNGKLKRYCWFACDVMVTMLVGKTLRWEVNFINMQVLRKGIRLDIS